MEYIPDGLVEHLVDEISISGNLGSTVHEVLSYLERYFQRNEEQTHLNLASDDPQYGLLDFNFQTRLWSRLASHPDIILKKHREADINDQLSQTQLQAHGELRHNSRNLQRQSTSAGSELPSPSQSAEDELSWSIGISRTDRLYTTKARSYNLLLRAVEDPTDFSEAELSILSAIAANREHGALRGDLFIVGEQDPTFIDTFIRRMESIGLLKRQSDPVGIDSDRFILSRYNTISLGSNHADAEFKALRTDNSEKENNSATHKPNYASAQFDPQTTAIGPSRDLVQLMLPTLRNRTILHDSDGVKNNGNIKMGESLSPDEPTQNVAPDDEDSAMEWIPQRDNDSTYNRTATPSKMTRGKPKRKYKNPEYKPKGRPRKFFRGTEAFWRSQFAMIKRGQTAIDMSTIDLAADPTTFEIFAQRPQNFDEVLVRAAENGLPIPAKPEHITQEWVTLTLRILNRTEDGLYLSLSGEHINDWKVKKPPSQIFILKSARLRELDLSDQHTRKVAKVRFISSNTAHTMHYLRYYPTMARERPLYIPYSESPTQAQSELAWPEHVRQALIRPPVTPSTPNCVSLLEYYPSSPSLMLKVNSVLSRPEPSHKRAHGDQIQESQRKRRRTRTKTVEGVNEMTLKSDKNRKSFFSTLEMIEVPTESQNPFGLPPPLTTRGARRRQQAVQELQKSHTMAFYSEPSLQPLFSQTLKFSMQDPATQKWNITATMKKFQSFNSLNAWNSLNQIVDTTTAEDDIPHVDDADGDSDFEYNERDLSPPPKIRQAGRGNNFSRLRRDIILDIVDSCSGLVPLNKTFPANEFARIWRERSQGAAIDERMMKQSIKSLVNSGRLKQLKFSFRCQTGNMVLGTILAIPQIKVTNQGVKELQRNVIDAYPSDYIPDGMDAGDKELEFIAVRAKPRMSSRPSRKLNLTRGSIILSLKFLTDSGRQAYKNVVAAALSTRRSVKRKLIWMKTPGVYPPPESLEGILVDDPIILQIRPTEEDDELVRLDWEIDTVMKWELRTYDFFQSDRTHSIFINFTCTEQVQPNFRQETYYRFTELAWYTRDGKQAPYPFPQTPLPDLYNETEYLYETPSLEEEATPARKKRRALGPTPITDRYAFPDSTTTKYSTPRRRPNRDLVPARSKFNSNGSRRKQPPNFVVNMSGHIFDSTRDGMQKLPIKRQRGAQYLRNMPEEEVYRIAVTVVVVRTLAGGLEKFIDWSLVMRNFPGQEEQFIKDRWKTLSSCYRRDMAGLTESLQERYLAAFVRGEVPGVDFADLETGTDWVGICEWAIGNLDGGGRSGAEELPGSSERRQWVAGREFVFEEFKAMRELLGYNINATNPRKEQALAGTVFAVPLPGGDDTVKFKVLPEVEHQNDPDLMLARSWVLATVLTSPANYDEFKIRAKMMKLAPTNRQVEELVDRALKGLQRDKLIVRNQHTRIAGVLEGGWEVSAKMYEFFEGKRMVTRTMLKDAALFKIRRVDVQLALAGSMLSKKDAMVDDGHMVAILNLVAAGRVKLSPGSDVPNSRYGLDWRAHGYQTRLLDKRVLAFSIVISATADYVHGDPVTTQRNTPIPRGDLDFKTGRIPMWFDILGNFQREMWEIVLTAVVGIVSVRAGIGEVEITRTLASALTVWEVGLVLGWAEKAGFVRRTGVGRNCWTTDEWWWLVLGVDWEWVA